MSDNTVKISQELKAHGDAIHKSMKNLAENIKLEHIAKHFGDLKAKGENKDG